MSQIDKLRRACARVCRLAMLTKFVDPEEPRSFVRFLEGLGMRCWSRRLAKSVLCAAVIAGGCAKDKDDSRWSEKRLAKERKKVMDDMQKRFDEMQEEMERDLDRE
jgi:hypothetical protein